jgi:replicative DNA helicase
MLLDRDAIAKVVELIRPEDFYRDAHRRIYEAIADLFERGEPVDLITVTDRLRNKGQLEDVGGAGYITAMLNAIPTAANVEYYARIVLQKSMLRHLIAAGTEIAHMGFEGEHDVEFLVDRAEKLVFGIANRRLQQEFLPIRDILKESFERIDRRYQDKGTVTGVPTGFTDLDLLTSGLQPADLVIVAARPAMGKCLRYDAEIVDAQTGEVRTIQEIVSRGEAQLWTLTAGGMLEPTAAAQFVDDGIKPVYRVRTASGREVETTLSHPFLTLSGWRPLAGITEGEPIAVPTQLPVFGNADLPAYEVKLLAYLSAGFMPTDPTLAADLADAVSAGDAIHAATKPTVATAAVMAPVQGGSEAEIVGVVQARYRGLTEPIGARTLPAGIFTLPRKKLALFLSRFLACTSTVEPEPTLTVRSTLPSRRLARQVQHLLLRFEVVARVDESGLTVTGEAVRRLFQQVGILGYERLRTWARHDQRYLLEPEVIAWDPITAIEYAGDVQVYDLTVPETHNFIANDVCVHNTTFCMNLGAHAAIHHQVPVALFSLETSKEQLVQRFLCSEAEVDGSKLRTGFLADSDWPKLARAMGRLSEAPIFVDDSATVSVIEMRAKSRKLKAEHGLGLIVVDYLQMIQSYKRTENRTQEISEIARSLKSLAKELNIPLIAISQLSRAVELTGTRRPLLSHLRESGELEQVADLVVFIFRDDYYNPETEKKNIAEIIIAKHRNGPIGQVELFFHKEHSRFANLERRRG